jgi:hypothetical protein
MVLQRTPIVYTHSVYMPRGEIVNDDVLEIVTLCKNLFKICQAMNVGPCHYGMARPRVANGRTATNMECSCE